VAKKLAVGIPWQQEMMWTSFLFTFWQTDIPKDALLIQGDKATTWESRNHIVREALKWGADELLFMDVDQAFPGDVLARLRSHDKDIISGWTPIRKQPHTPLVFKRENGGYGPILPQGQIQEVDGFGFGCVLLKTHVFEKIRTPWFESTFFPHGHERAGDLETGHDLNFCQRAQEAGFSLWVDNTAACGHIMNVMIDQRYAMENIKHLIAQEVIEKKAKEAGERRIHLAH